MFQPGEVVFHQGVDPDGTYLILSGQLDVEVVIPNVGPKRLSRLKPGRVVGELSLLDDIPRSARVRAWHASELLCLDNQRFREMREALDPAAYKVIRNILKIMCSRLRMTNEQLHPGKKKEGMAKSDKTKLQVEKKTGAWGRLRSLLVGG